MADERVAVVTGSGKASAKLPRFKAVNTLLGTFPADGPQPPILPPVNGYLFLDRGKFRDSFAAIRSSSPI